LRRGIIFDGGALPVFNGFRIDENEKAAEEFFKSWVPRYERAFKFTKAFQACVLSAIDDVCTAAESDGP
jgi:hypothetical protein